MKRVLVAPLDWGLGHATRCIPIIRALQARGCTVLLAGSGDALQVLRQEFPALSYAMLPAYQPRYPRTGESMVWGMARQLPKFMNVIRREHVALERFVQEQSVDLVISDNRYGCWSASVPSIFITHQCTILMPRRFGWLASIVGRMNQRSMKRFTRCWLPDYPGEASLAGKLVECGEPRRDAAHRYIGALSRLAPAVAREKRYDLVCVFSGPEPQRTLLEQQVTAQVNGSALRVLIVRGVPDGRTLPPLETRAEVVDFLASDALQVALETSHCVLARSGFSTVMDLAHVGGNAIFVPTPGQTEQEYLAARLREKKIAYSVAQQDFHLDTAWQQVPLYTGFIPADGERGVLLQRAIDEALMLS
jgi:UDP:flavonoid glycosyltransferase YjiC (YdhE family)